MNEDIKGRRPFEIVSLSLISVASAIGWLIFGSSRVFTGVWAGGLIGIANFKWLGSIVRRVFAQGKAAGYIGYTVRYLLKFLFVAVSSALLIYSRLVDPLAFLVGFTITITTVALQGAGFISRSR